MYPSAKKSTTYFPLEGAFRHFVVISDTSTPKLANHAKYPKSYMVVTTLRDVYYRATADEMTKPGVGLF